MQRAVDMMGIFERVLCVVCLVPFLVGAGTFPPPDPIIEAARRGDVVELERLLEQGADVNSARGDGMTALHFAAEQGDGEVVRILLQAEADVAAGTRIGHYTPLHLASRGGHVAVAKSLLEAGADARAPTTSSGSTPLHLAASSAGGGAELIALLTEYGADVNARELSAGQTPLMFAAEAGGAEAAAELLERGADPTVTTKVVDALAGYVRDRAADLALREAITEFRRSDGPVEEPTSESPDLYANQGFVVPATARLPVFAGENWRPTPAQVQEAIQKQREVAAREYVVTDTMSLVGPEISKLNAQGLTVVHDKLPERVIRVGRSGGMTALLLAAREGQVEVAEALLDGGADVNQLSAGNGVSPLLIASLNGEYDVALLLVERGADPKLASSPENATPLFAVLQSYWSGMPNYPQPQSHHLQVTTHLELLEALLEAGADPNVRLSKHIWYWEYSQRRTGVTIRGATPFFRAAFARDLEAMKLLVAHGADPHTPTIMTDELMRGRRPPDGRQEESSGLPQVPGGAPHMYPIHAVAGGGFQGIGNYMMEGRPGLFLTSVKYLVEEFGADVNVPDSWGYTPLHYAALRGDLEMIRYLVDKGADVETLTRLGMSPVDMTRGGQRAFFKAEGHPEAQELLEKLGSPLVCKDLHYDGTGNLCEAAGTSTFEDLYGFPRTPLYLRPPSEKFGWQVDETIDQPR